MAVGAPLEDVGTVGNTGAVTVLYGGANGLTGAGAQQIGQDTGGMPGTSEANDAFGTATALADVTGDGRADLTAGSPGENGTDGAVWVLRGTTTGLSLSGVLAFNAGTLGVAGRRAELGQVLLP